MDGRITLTDLSKLLQKSPATISAGIRQGVFPFAIAEYLGGKGKKAKIVVFPGKLEEYVTGAEGEYDLSTKSIAKMLGLAEITVQVLVRMGRFPFGVAYKTSPENKQYTYVYFPKKFEEFMVERNKRLAS